MPNSDTTVELEFDGVGQTITIVPPEAWLGAPSGSISVTCRRGSLTPDDAADWTATGSLDAVTGSLAAAAGPNETYRDLITLSAGASGVTVGNAYRLDNGYGQCEVVKAKKVVAASQKVYADASILYDHPIGSAFEGVQMTVVVPTAWAIDEKNLTGTSDVMHRIVWSYSVAGVARKHVTYARLVRQTWQSIVTLEDLKQLWPDVGSSEAVDLRGEQMRRTIAAAEATFRVDSRLAGVSPDELRDVEVVKALVCRQALVKLAERGIAPAGRDVEAFLVDARAQYQSLFDRAIGVVTKVEVAKSTGGSTEPVGFVNPFVER